MTKQRVLMIAAKANMIAQFNMRNIKILKDLGYEVHVGANFEDFGTMDSNANDSLIKELKQMDVTIHQLNFSRGLGNFKQNNAVIKDIRCLLQRFEYSFIHVHSPIGSVLGRIAAKTERVPVVYTAHGFHFFKGGPLKNWLFLPVEVVLMFFTDHLIVINHEDQAISKMMPIKNVTYIPSIGSNVEHALNVSDAEKMNNRLKVRSELGISNEDYVILNVGELSVRKNQKAIIEAVSELKNNQNIKILLAGVTNDIETYENFVERQNMQGKVYFLGYRTDLHELHNAADLMVMPSLREGFGMGGFDALVDGLYMIGSKNTGMADYIKNDSLGLLVSPTNVHDIKDAIYMAYTNSMKPDLTKNTDFLMQFDIKNVDSIMKQVYLKYLD